MERDAAFVDFVQTRWARYYRLARLIAGEALADEALQDALLQVYRCWRRVERAESPDAYVKRVVVNRCISVSSKNSHRHVRLDDYEHALPTLQYEGMTAARIDLWEHVMALPPRQRAVITLRYYEDLSEREIAEVIGCAPGTVKAHAAAALKNLRPHFESTGIHRSRE